MSIQAAMIVAGAYGVMSVVAFVAYGVDKRRAERGKWRVPEGRFHLLELLGGWPGAFLGQRVFRHKGRKGSYMAVYWVIVALHGAGWAVWAWWVMRGR